MNLSCYRCYYSVVLGWCFYFLFRSIFYKLPETTEESLKTWDIMQVVHNDILHKYVCFVEIFKVI